jgi:predicted nucleic acid-binding protein
MNGFLVDTNVISEILRPAPDAHVAAWSQRIAKPMLFLSVVSMGELRKGVAILPASDRRVRLEKSIEEQVPLWFQGRILSVTQNIAERWGELDGTRQLAGRPLSVPDGMIAATALEHDLTVVTRNVKDFALLGVALIIQDAVSQRAGLSPETKSLATTMI